jgi:DNA processing protein
MISGKKSIAKNSKNDEFLEFCHTNPTYDAVVSKFPNEVFEAELSGVIRVKNGRVHLV